MAKTRKPLGERYQTFIASAVTCLLIAGGIVAFHKWGPAPAQIASHKMGPR